VSSNLIWYTLKEKGNRMKLCKHCETELGEDEDDYCCSGSHVDLLETENAKLKNAASKASKEIDFAIKFSESRGIITTDILNGIKNIIDGK